MKTYYLVAVPKGRKPGIQEGRRCLPEGTMLLPIETLVVKEFTNWDRGLEHAFRILEVRPQLARANRHSLHEAVGRDECLVLSGPCEERLRRLAGKDPQFGCFVQTLLGARSLEEKLRQLSQKWLNDALAGIRVIEQISLLVDDLEVIHYLRGFLVAVQVLFFLIRNRSLDPWLIQIEM